MPMYEGYDRSGPTSKYANHKGGYRKDNDTTLFEKFNFSPDFKPMASLGAARMRSKDRYPNSAKGQGGGIPPNTTNGGGEATGYTGVRSKDRYPGTAKGNHFPMPPATASICPSGVALKSGDTYANSGVSTGKAGTTYPGKRAG